MKGQVRDYAPGSLVVLGEWSQAIGLVVPREWRGGWWDPTYHKVIGNYAATTGVVVLEHQRTGARTEVDGQTPVMVDQCKRA